MRESVRRAYLDAMGIEVWNHRALHADSGACEIEEGNSPQPLNPIPEAVQPRESQEARQIPQPSGPPIAELDWPSLRERVASCTACVLSESRTQAVFGVGNQNADLLIIGEAPGADEDRQGEPFVGRAGKLLNEMLLAIGFKREQVFIANILKCRPPGNRDPKPEEAEQCKAFLERQIELLSPKLILSVVRVSAHNQLQTDVAVGRLRGRIHHYSEREIPLVVTYHPAYLLRSPEQKAKAWQDLQLVFSQLRITI